MSGKVYNGEKAIISLTSWKARINTVGSTIFSLLRNCPGFHIVLVLSEQEFPGKTRELPPNLMLLVDRGLVELMWVYKNYKPFKKLLPTQCAYRDCPIIIVDDGVVYRENFATKLYNEWYADKGSIYASCVYRGYGISWGVGGAGIIFPPACFVDYYPKCLSDNILNTHHDDALYGILANKKGIAFKQSRTVVWQKIYADTDEGVRSSMHYHKLYSDSMIPQMIKEVDAIC